MGLQRRALHARDRSGGALSARCRGWPIPLNSLLQLHNAAMYAEPNAYCLLSYHPCSEMLGSVDRRGDHSHWNNTNEFLTFAIFFSVQWGPVHWSTRR